jgi:PucR C-terminal helix-turn-helix domain
VDAIIEAIRATVPAYARPLEGTFGANIRMGVERALGDFLDEIEGRPPPDPSATYEGLGRLEAREGRTMDALLTAYRTGARVSWRRASALAGEAGFAPETLALLAESFFAYIEELAARSAQGYAEEQSRLEGETARRRRSLMRLMIREPAADQAAVEAAARETGWEPPASLAALVWSDVSEQPVSRRLPPGSLVAGLDDELICALVPDPAAPGRRAELEAALGRRRGALGPVVDPAEAGRSARRARSLAALLAGEDGPHEGGVVAADERMADLVVHADRELGAELAAELLAPLADLSDQARQRLLETLAAWLDHQGSAPRVAEELHVHPQTVRYRVGQLRELFDDRLDDPRARFELSLAVRYEGSGA